MQRARRAESTEGRRLRVMREMAVACGEAGSFAVLTMSSPPLKHDREAIDKLLVCAELGIPLVLAPAAGCATSAPASIAAAVVVCNAVVLSGLVLHQLVSPGARFVYGVGVGAMNMSTAVDVYCAPEAFLGDQSGATLLHDVGHFESGLQSSLDSVVLGDELVGYVRAFMRGVPVDDDALALDEIEAVGPGGNHLARPYTRRHFHSFWRPGPIDQAAHNRWHAEGATTLAERTRSRVDELRRAPRAFSLPEVVLDPLEELSETDLGALRAAPAR